MRTYPKNELIKWSNTFACGVQVIDDQHKGLVKLVNELFNHVSGNVKEEREYFNKVINEAVQYIKVHFTTEEKIMRATGFSGYAEHKRAHESFILNVVYNAKEYQENRRVSLYAFTKFLKEWILCHVALIDKQYFEYFNRIASRKADGKLSISAEDVTRLRI